MDEDRARAREMLIVEPETYGVDRGRGEVRI
jgi:hypothetical protein